VNIDYHAVVDYHGYSVPYQLMHRELEVRSTATTVEFFDQGKRVAAHVRSYLPGKFTTLEEHRPKSHQRYLDWTPGPAGRTAVVVAGKPGAGRAPAPGAVEGRCLPGGH
jgi:transposase